MNAKRGFYITLIAALVTAVSAFYAYKRLQIGPGQSPNNPIQIGREPAPQLPVVVEAAQKDLVCKQSASFASYRNRLGEIINKSSDTPKIKMLEEFKKNFGLPIPVGISQEQLKNHDLVFSCKPACGEKVHLMFVSNITAGKQEGLTALTESGKRVKLRRSIDGVELAIIDELSIKGVPFKSWVVPMASGPWSIIDNDIYYGLDFFGYSLKIKPGSGWELAKNPQKASVFEKLPPAAIAGCSVNDLCWKAQAGKITRYFKSPRVCD
jgi:hypothetical protein